MKLVRLSTLSRANSVVSLISNTTAAPRLHIVMSSLDHCSKLASLNTYLLPRIHIVKPADSSSATSLLTALFANFSELIFGTIRKVAWVGMSSSRCLCGRCVASQSRAKKSADWRQSPWEE